MTLVEAPAHTNVLELRGIEKSFGGVQALRGVDLTLSRGEVVGLVGDNGAGKSTLIKSITGVHRIDRGEILGDGDQQKALTPGAAQRLGIETIHQNLALVNTLDVTANIFINRERVRGGRGVGRIGWLHKRAMHAESARALEAFGLAGMSLSRPVANLSGGQRQIVAIARAVYWQPRIVMMDEPTAALSVGHARSVLDLVRSLAEQGIAVLFVSHDMQHVLEVTDRIVVLRHGAKVAELSTPRTSHQEIVMYITGHRDAP
jgi:ABC-type sugar transport system ATPase subunit